MTVTGFGNSVRNIWNFLRICSYSCCWIIGLSVAFETTSSPFESSGRSLEISQHLPGTPRLSALCEENKFHYFKRQKPKRYLGLFLIKALPFSDSRYEYFQNRETECEDQQPAVFLVSINSDAIFIKNFTSCRFH